jgi:hypothetical protein
MATRSAAKLVSVIGVIASVFGAVGVLSPATMGSIEEMFRSPAAIYSAAAIRLAVGALLIWVGPSCRPDKRWVGLLVRGIGVLAILAAIVLVVLGPAHVQEFIAWSSNQPTFLRGVSLFVLIVGGFLVYAGL